MPESDPSLARPERETGTPAFPTPGAAGWYGKLPAAGDFVSRRLPEGFVQSWDHWLQQGLAHSREQLGERWRAIFLTFPVWRFIVPAGAVDDSAWCGILLPSVDRVGRCFPLTVCRRLGARTDATEHLVAIDRELAGFTEVALHALDGASVEAFDDALLSHPRASADSGVARARDAPAAALALEAFTDPRACGHWALAPSLDRALADAADRLILDRLGERSLWWRAPAAGSPGTMRLDGLPLRAALLSALIAHD